MTDHECGRLLIALSGLIIYVSLGAYLLIKAKSEVTSLISIILLTLPILGFGIYLL